MMTNGRDQYLNACWLKVQEFILANRYFEPEIVDNALKPAYILSFTSTKVIIVCQNQVGVSIIRNEIVLFQTIFQNLFELDNAIVVEPISQYELEHYLQATKDPFQIGDLLNFKSDETADFASMPIHPDRTFKNFVKGDCNRESLVAALACAYDPGASYNPLFIYGNSGVGKTHLLMAIANYIQLKYPTMNVYYIESLKFVEKVVKAIQDGKIEQFKKYLCQQDILLVDDIQFLAGKEKSHEVFFTIFNDLINHKKQICIASDRHPNEIQGLEDRLITRFSSGLSVGIDTPEFETSLAILKMKLANTNIGEAEIDDRGLEYIASNYASNIRDLEGALNRVIFYAINFAEDGSNKIDGVISFDTVVNALKSQPGSSMVLQGENLTVDKVIKAVSDYYGLTKQQITGKTRTRNIANARHIAIYLSRKLLDMPYTKIGENFGGRDHSTVMSSYTKVEKLIQKDPAFTKAIHDIEEVLQ